VDPTNFKYATPHGLYCEGNNGCFQYENLLAAWGCGGAVSGSAVLDLQGTGMIFNRERTICGPSNESYMPVGSCKFNADNTRLEMTGNGDCGAYITSPIVLSSTEIKYMCDGNTFKEAPLGKGVNASQCMRLCPNQQDLFTCNNQSQCVFSAPGKAGVPHVECELACKHKQ
jgi:hypothetical protein